jgi:NAD(P)-dependent dehydrogenase (short-subunit alcohol dehydrogenase family)
MSRHSSKGEVVVLGASTGVGWATALRLHQLGYSVVATVRQPGDAARLRAQGIEPFRLDVTTAADLEALRTAVGARPLVGVVNNVGVNSPGPLEYANAEDLRQLFEVNVIGHVGAVQAMLAGLRAGGGRVVTLGSPAGRFASPLNGAYGATKAALGLLNDTWRRELAPHGVKVVVVEPGGMKTPFLTRTADTLQRFLDEGSPELRARYGPQIDASLTSMRKMYGPFASSPDVVAKVICKALVARRPRSRYQVGVDAHAMSVLGTYLPSRLLDEVFRRSVPGSHDQPPT